VFLRGVSRGEPHPPKHCGGGECGATDALVDAQVQLVRSRGGNTMECGSADGGVSLYWLPAKFSKVIWAQRGDFLIVEPDTTATAEAGGRDSKVTGTIVHILFPEQVAHLRKLPCWPEGFAKETKKSEEPSSDSPSASKSAQEAVVLDASAAPKPKAANDGIADDEDDEGSEGESDDDDDLFVNNNHQHEDLIGSDDD
jgi:hypothetical protein